MLVLRPQKIVIAVAFPVLMHHTCNYTMKLKLHIHKVYKLNYNCRYDPYEQANWPICC